MTVASDYYPQPYGFGTFDVEGNKLRVLVGIVNLLILTTSLGANEISSGFLDFLSFEGENADAASVLSTESTFIFRFSDIDAAYL